jgi:protein PhnA
MSLDRELLERCESKCELCGASESLDSYTVPPKSVAIIDNCAALCLTCRTQIEDPDSTDPNHWRCLNDSMWSQVPAVQVLVWRMLDRLKSEGWPQDLLDMLFLDETTTEWAQSLKDENEGGEVRHLDSNGAQLASGDSVVLIKDLNVKGANFTAKRGAAVRNISLVADNAEHIEGRVNGQHIVILTKFVKKSG